MKISFCSHKDFLQHAPSCHFPIDYKGVARTGSWGHGVIGVIGSNLKIGKVFNKREIGQWKYNTHIVLT